MKQKLIIIGWVVSVCVIAAAFTVVISGMITDRKEAVPIWDIDVAEAIEATDDSDTIPMPEWTKPHAEPVICSVCGRDMRDKDGTAYIGMDFHYAPDGTEDDFHDVYPELRDAGAVKVCYVCWFRALGVALPNLGLTHD